MPVNLENMLKGLTEELSGMVFRNGRINASHSSRLETGGDVLLLSWEEAVGDDPAWHLDSQRLLPGF